MLDKSQGYNNNNNNNNKNKLKNKGYLKEIGITSHATFSL
jgi:hypothetical protein